MTPPPHHQQPPPGPPPISVPYHDRRPSSRGSTWRIIVILAVVLTLIGTAAVTLVLYDHRDDVSLKATARSMRAGAQLRDAISDGRLTDEELHGIDPTDLWWEEFRTMVQRPVLHTIHEYTAKTDHQIVRQQLTVDLRNHQFAYETSTHGGRIDGAPNDVTAERCIDAHTYTRSKRPGKPASPWARGGQTRCEFKWLDPGLFADGLGTGALTAGEADAMISYLRKRDNFLRARQARVVTHNGKQYVRFAVEITPVHGLMEKYIGMNRFDRAFLRTGLAPGSHPYRLKNLSNGGERLIMYVDPATLLPAYAQSSDTAPADSDSGVRDEQEFAAKLTDTSVDRVEFDFTQQQVVPQTLKDVEDISLHWPEEEYPPHVGDWQP